MYKKIKEVQGCNNVNCKEEVNEVNEVEVGINNVKIRDVVYSFIGIIEKQEIDLIII